MRQTKTFKVMLLPTEKASQICKYTDNDNKLEYYTKPQVWKDIYSNQPQALYIISDDEIKEGDWCMLLDSFGTPMFGEPQQYLATKGQVLNDGLRKVVATTDNSINVNYPIKEIPESFIQVYIKAYNEGKLITEVDLEMEANYNSNNNDYYLIKTRPDNTVIIHQSKMYSKKEVEKLCEKAFRAGREAQSNLNGNKCPSAWIEDNL